MAKSLNFLLVLLAALAGGCASPAQPERALVGSGPLKIDDSGRFVDKSEAVNPPSDDPTRPWELVWALTEDTYNENELFLTVHRRPNKNSPEYSDLLGGYVDMEYMASIYVQAAGRYKLLHQLMSFNSYFLKPNYFMAKWSEDSGYDSGYILQITEVFYGTGALVAEHIYYPRPNLTLEEVAFTPAPEFYQGKLLPGEMVAKGEYNEFNNQGLFFHFAIWKKDDGNCCPTAGQVDGAYKLERPTRDSPLRIFVDSYHRRPIDPNH